MERDRAGDPGSDLARTVRGTGCADAGCGCSRVRGRDINIWRARCALKPAGASSARARGRTRGGGGALHRALVGDAGRASRHPQGRGRLSAARPEIIRPSGFPSCLPTLAHRSCVTRAALHPQLPVHGIRIVCLDAEAGAIAQPSTSAPKSGLEPQNAAYVIYTSGSTGTPKSVVIDHASLTNKVLTLGMDFGAGPDLRVALLSSPGFDPSIEQVDCALGSWRFDRYHQRCNPRITRPVLGAMWSARRSLS